MLLVNGTPAMSFAQTVIGAIRKIAGPGSIPIGLSQSGGSGGMTEVPIRSSPTSRILGHAMLITVASSRKKVEIYETSAEVDGMPSSWFAEISPQLGRLNLNLSPLEHLVWSDKAKGTTKWETKPLYIILAHELTHALRWVQGASGREKAALIKKITPSLGKITLPDGRQIELVKWGDDDMVATALENRLLEWARSRGAKVGEIVAYGFLRNPKTGKEALGSYKKLK